MGAVAWCPDCNLAYARLGRIGGYFHEEGCPSDWKDRHGIGLPAPCWNCGYDFIPEERPHRYSLCPDCLDPELMEDDDE